MATSKNAPGNNGNLKARLKGVFGSNSDKILELIETNETDSAIALTKKTLLASALGLIPDAEANVKDSGGSKGVYQYTSLVTTARQLIEDLQAMQDTGLIADSINNSLVKPTFLNTTQFMVDSHFRLRNALMDIVPDKHSKTMRKLVDDTAKSIASYMQQECTELGDRIKSRIVE